MLSRDGFPSELLLVIGQSEYAESRMMTLMHPNRTPALVEILIDDPDPDVAHEARRALSYISA